MTASSEAPNTLTQLIAQYGVDCAETKELAPRVALADALKAVQVKLDTLVWLDRFGLTLWNTNEIDGMQFWSLKWCDEDGGTHLIEDRPLLVLLTDGMHAQQARSALSRSDLT